MNKKKVKNPLTGRLVNKDGKVYKNAIKTKLKKDNSLTEYQFENILNYLSNNSNNNFYIHYHKKKKTPKFINSDNENMNNNTRKEFNQILKELSTGKLKL